MKRLLLFWLSLFSVPLAALAQPSPGSSPANRVRVVTALPSTCTRGQVLVLTTDNLFYSCGPDNTWNSGSGFTPSAANLTLAPVTLTDAAPIATDASLGFHFKVTLGDNRTLANPTNPTNGQIARWEFIQDGTGNRTITLGSQFNYGTDISEIVLSTAANKRDLMTAVYDSGATKWRIIGFIKGFDTASAAMLPGISTLNTLTGATQTLAVDTTTGSDLAWSSSGTAHTLRTGTDIVTKTVGITIDGGGSAITTGVKGYVEVPFNATIVAATTLADQSGSIVIDVWKQVYASYPPVDAQSITASAPPTISTATKAQDTTLTGWTTSITAGDILGFNVDSCTTITRATLILKLRVN